MSVGSDVNVPGYDYASPLPMMALIPHICSSGLESSSPYAYAEAAQPFIAQIQGNNEENRFFQSFGKSVQKAPLENGLLENSESMVARSNQPPLTNVCSPDGSSSRLRQNKRSIAKEKIFHIQRGACSLGRGAVDKRSHQDGNTSCSGDNEENRPLRSKRMHTMAELRYRNRLNQTLNKLSETLKKTKDYKPNSLEQSTRRTHKTDVLVGAINYINRAEVEMRYLTEEIHILKNQDQNAPPSGFDEIISLVETT